MCLSIDVFENSEELFENLLNELGPHLYELQVDFEFLSYSNSSGVFQSCDMLKYLTVHGLTLEVDLGNILRPCDGQLLKLDLSGHVLNRNAADAISNYCGGLEHLSLDFIQCEGKLTSIWRTIGPSLESVYFGSLFFHQHGHDEPGTSETHASGNDEDETVIFEDLPQFCANRIDLILGNTDYRQQAIDLCTAFGASLRSLNVIADNNLSATDFGEIVDECTSAEFDVAVGSEDADILLTLGSRVRNLRVNECPNESVEEIGEQCTGIEELNVIAQYEYDTAKEFLSDFFLESKHYLRVLKLDFEYHTFNEDNDAFDILSRLTDSIEELWCTSRGFATGTFSDFASENQSIRTVHITCKSEELDDDEREDLEDETASIVTEFSSCPLLTELEIENAMLPSYSALIMQACSNLRGRDVDIYVGGYQYLV